MLARQHPKEVNDLPFPRQASPPPPGAWLFFPRVTLPSWEWDACPGPLTRAAYYTACIGTRALGPTAPARSFMLETAALAAGLSWTSGFRLYLAVFAAGALARAGWLHLPPGLHALESWWVIALAGVLAIAEFLADKVPGFDSVWDGIHTFIRIPAGAILAAGAFGQLDPQWVVAAGLVGGTLAGAAHATKASTRALINVSPEPFSNWIASFSEDVAASGGLLMAFFLPVAFLVGLGLLLLIVAWLLPKLWRGMRRLRDTVSSRTPGHASARPPRSAD